MGGDFRDETSSVGDGGGGSGLGGSVGNASGGLSGCGSGVGGIGVGGSGVGGTGVGGSGGDVGGSGGGVAAIGGGVAGGHDGSGRDPRYASFEDPLKKLEESLTELFPSGKLWSVYIEPEVTGVLEHTVVSNDEVGEILTHDQMSALWIRYVMA